MLNMNIESNINSIPYLLYMSEQEKKRIAETKNKIPFGERTAHH